MSLQIGFALVGRVLFGVSVIDECAVLYSFTIANRGSYAFGLREVSWVLQFAT